jgi:hypothetical protein
MVIKKHLQRIDKLYEQAMKDAVYSHSWLHVCVRHNTGNVRIRQHWSAFKQPLLQRKAISRTITYSECVPCSLRYSVCNAHALYFIVIYVLPRCTTVSHIISWTAPFSKKSCGTQNLYFDFLYNFCLKHFFILRRNERDMIKNIYRYSCEAPVILVRFWWNLTFIVRISKNTQTSNFIKNMFNGSTVWTDGQTRQS